MIRLFLPGIISCLEYNVQRPTWYQYQQFSLESHTFFFRHSNFSYFWRKKLIERKSHVARTYRAISEESPQVQRLFRGTDPMADLIPRRCIGCRWVLIVRSWLRLLEELSCVGRKLTAGSRAECCCLSRSKLRLRSRPVRPPRHTHYCPLVWNELSNHKLRSLMKISEIWRKWIICILLGSTTPFLISNKGDVSFGSGNHLSSRTTQFNPSNATHAYTVEHKISACVYI